MVAKNCDTGETWEVFKAPELPENASQMHFMNQFSLQLNLMSSKLKKKLPPTDSRLREDVRAWEHADLEASQAEKYRLEQNQRKRRKGVKEMLKTEGVEMNMYDEQSFYCPKFFDKEIVSTDPKGKVTYFYRPKPGDLYWRMREQGEWSSLPRIFEDDCPPFYK